MFFKKLLCYLGVVGRGKWREEVNVVLGFLFFGIFDFYFLFGFLSKSLFENRFFLEKEVWKL